MTMDLGYLTRRLTRRSLVAGLAAAAIAPAIIGGTQRAAAEGAAEWRQLGANAAGPIARWDHTLAADDAGKQLILFGGRDAGGASLADTWLYDREEGGWTQLDAAGPEPRFGHAVAVDQQTRRLYLFGGESAALFYNDVWQLDLEELSWSRIDTSDSALPSPRYGTSAVLDAEGRLIVSHGFTFEGRFDDTWSLDLTTGQWTDVSPAAETRPLKRCLHEAIWDTTAERMMLFGGCSSGFGPCPQGDLWAFDPANRAWTDITAAGPAARSNPALVFDRARKQSILFAGLTDAGRAADLWTGRLADDGFAWSEMAVEGDLPAPRSSHDAVMTAGALYVFGGAGDGTTYNDLWRLKLPEAAE